MKSRLVLIKLNLTQHMAGLRLNAIPLMLRRHLKAKSCCYHARPNYKRATPATSNFTTCETLKLPFRVAKTVFAAVSKPAHPENRRVRPPRRAVGLRQRAPPRSRGTGKLSLAENGVAVFVMAAREGGDADGRATMQQSVLSPTIDCGGSGEDTNSMDRLRHYYGNWLETGP